VPETENVFGALEARFLESPGLAVAQSRQVASQMAELVKHHYEISIDLLYSFDAQRYQESRDLEVLIDDYEDHLGTYMVQISARQLTDKDSRTLTQMMQSIGDFERISDHAYSIALSAKEMYDKKITFSDAALNELAVKERALQDLLDMTVQAFRDDDLELAARVEPLEEVIDGLNDELRARHVKRLQDGFCTLELGLGDKNNAEYEQQARQHQHKGAQPPLLLANAQIAHEKTDTADDRNDPQHDQNKLKRSLRIRKREDARRKQGDTYQH
jgi:phosphate:Na+ symporter